MATSKYGQTVGIHMPKALLPFIDEAAQARGATRSRMVALILMDQVLSKAEPSPACQIALDRALLHGELPAAPPDFS